ncbi:hypothetical protein KY289_036840 [Solanum tuberosum]|nr:hypothetical protein KY289_036840 [Solanum tuberosum]
MSGHGASMVRGLEGLGVGVAGLKVRRLEAGVGGRGAFGHGASRAGGVLGDICW